MSKYITFTGAADGAIIFPAWLQHKDMAANRTVLGAGFLDAQGKCHGYSDSLGIGVAPGDQELLDQLLQKV